jgi:drug/metabolite transporter (DMT)-like permease
VIQGLLYMVTASALFAAMGGFVYQVRLWDHNASALTASFIRVVVNLIFVCAIASRKGFGKGFLDLFGDMRWSLWARGFFGTLSLMAMFTAIHKIGLGEASFLHSFNAVWIAALSPFVLGQPNSVLSWVAIVLGLTGLYFLYQPAADDGNLVGRSIALASGAFAGTAYMMIARAGRSNPPLTVVFYFSLVATIVHLVWFYVDDIIWPADVRSWLMLLASGVFASVAQIFMTKAYQSAPAAFISAVSYSSPIFSLLVSIFVFGLMPNGQSLIGASVVVLAGVILPYVQGRRAALDSQKIPVEVTDR